MRIDIYGLLTCQGAWVSLVPGCPWCLGVLGAWVFLVPGCHWCLGVLGAWQAHNPEYNAAAPDSRQHNNCDFKIHS